MILNSLQSGNQRNGSRNQAATRQRLAWGRRVFLEDLLKGDDIPRSLSEVEDHFELSQSSARGLHQGAGDTNLQVYEENRRIRDHILQQGSENNTAQTSNNSTLSQGD
ncbi:hypothetical protein OS493_020922 [Desmophyllum pertusum]|uniref:Uncharacterized protein n=1 Tax=Desmophyllum pertusum TaxID=174260 RepID=A0A9X0A014_9CNID|nr:hypothetical protein OS493_020922 [Desmophyllum pertusum]